MEIKQFNDGEKGRFEAHVENENAGLLTFIWENKEKINVDHTEVFSGFEGKGVGKQLILASVEFARKNNLKINPTCPFAKKYLERSSEYEDVLQ